MTPSFRTLSRCLVCGFSEVRTDEVVDRGVVLLAECPRCRHRWTERRAADLSRSGCDRFSRIAFDRYSHRHSMDG